MPTTEASTMTKLDLKVPRLLHEAMQLSLQKIETLANSLEL
jgi:hypothetical protein